MADRIYSTESHFNPNSAMFDNTLKLRDNMSENDKLILLAYFKTIHVKDLFKWPVEAVADYRGALRSGIGYDPTPPQRIAAIDKLLRTTPYDVVRSFISMDIGQWRRLPYDQRVQLSFLMPPAFCEECDGSDQLVLLMHEDQGRKAFGNAWLNDQIEETGGNIWDFGIDMAGCPQCAYDDWAIVRTLFNRYSETRKGLCQCDGCRR